MENKQYKNAEWLHKKYVEEEMSARQIGQVCGVAHITILKWLQKFNIPRRAFGSHMGEKHHQWKGGRKAAEERRRKTEKYKESQKKWLKAHPNYMTEKCRKMKERAVEYKGGKCLACFIEFDGNNACIFDFHHRNPKEKELSIGALLSRKWEKIKPELDKTDMLCSNCHRLKHNGG